MSWPWIDDYLATIDAELAHPSNPADIIASDRWSGPEKVLLLAMQEKRPSSQLVAGLKHAITRGYKDGVAANDPPSMDIMPQPPRSDDEDATFYTMGYARGFEAVRHEKSETSSTGTLVAGGIGLGLGALGGVLWASKK